MIPPPAYVTLADDMAEGSGVRVRLRRTRAQVGGSSPHLPVKPAAQASAYVYLLWSRVSDCFYIGATNSLRRRLDWHNRGLGGAFTAKHAPWDLVGYEVHASYMAARRREATLKRNARMRFLFIKRAVNQSHPPIRTSFRQVGG